jgi:hypothetical protein
MAKGLRLPSFVQNDIRIVGALIAPRDRSPKVTDFDIIPSTTSGVQKDPGEGKSFAANSTKFGIK